MITPSEAVLFRARRKAGKRLRASVGAALLLALLAGGAQRLTDQRDGMPAPAPPVVQPACVLLPGGDGVDAICPG